MTEPAAALHPFLRRLAHRLLAKAERSASRPVRLALDRREAPELHDQVDAEALQRWILLLQDWCRDGPVALRLAPPREFASFTDRRPQLELLDFEALAAQAGYVPRSAHWQRQWAAQLAAAPFATPALLDYLARSPLAALEGLPFDIATGCLVALQALCREGRAMPLREASAQVFQGRSKVLDNRDELLRLLGAAAGQFTEPPIQLLVDLPASPRAVLFVENLVTFERMADRRGAAWQHDVLVYAAGFKGSARRLRTREGCRLYVRGGKADPRPVQDWLFEGTGWPVAFFGDLDAAGLRILAALREGFPQAHAWQPGYEALAQRLEQGGGHAPEQADKALQGEPLPTGCAYADTRLLPLLQACGRFIDQEAFRLDDAAG